LFGVVGRSAGGVPGFQYTADHKKLRVTWDAATLDKYVTNPRAMVPDTTMIYAGLKDYAARQPDRVSRDAALDVMFAG
jgi:cytochrome c